MVLRIKMSRRGRLVCIGVCSQRRAGAAPYDRVIHAAAGRHDVDAELILAIIMAESQLNPRAKSKKGARGLMQIMPVTADALDVANIYNPEETSMPALGIFGVAGPLRWRRAAGTGRLQCRGAKRAALQRIPPYPETRAYIARVLNYYAALKQDIFDF